MVQEARADSARVDQLGARFCIAALEKAFARLGQREIFNSHQSSLFASIDFTGILKCE